MPKWTQMSCTVIVLHNSSTSLIDVSLSTSFPIRCTFLKPHSVDSNSDFLPVVSLIQKSTRDPFHRYIVFQQAVRTGVYPQPYSTSLLSPQKKHLHVLFQITTIRFQTWRCFLFVSSYGVSPINSQTVFLKK